MSGKLRDLLLSALNPYEAPPRVEAPRMFQPDRVDPYEQPMGGLAPGNVDLYRQPSVPNPDGGRSTVYSFSVNWDGKEYLLPRVTPDGRLLSEGQAIQEFRKTGRHLGVFDRPEAATAAARKIHEDYERGKYNMPKFKP